MAREGSETAAQGEGSLWQDKPVHSGVIQGTDEILCRRECSAAGSALTQHRPPPSAVHGHSVRACTSSVGQRLPVDARAECLHSFGAVEQ